jgi:hypothetical protein
MELEVGNAWNLMFPISHVESAGIPRDEGGATGSDANSSAIVLVLVLSFREFPRKRKRKRKRTRTRTSKRTIFNGVTSLPVAPG